MTLSPEHEKHLAEELVEQGLAVAVAHDDASDTAEESAWMVMKEDLLALPADWRMVRVGRNKAPIAGGNWFDRDDYTPDDAAALNGSMPPAWGLKSGPASGVLVIDLDAEGWAESFEQVTGHPITDLPPTIAWTSGKQGRSGRAFSVPSEWWPALANRRAWQNPAGETLWELRWDRHQSVIIGAHPETGRYRWLPDCSPHDLPDPAEAPEWLLEALVVQEAPEAERWEPTADDAALAVEVLQHIPSAEHCSYSDWLRVGMALHHTDPGLLPAWVDWSRGCPTFDEPECLAKWRSFEKPYKGARPTVATLIWLAKQHGYQPPRRQAVGNEALTDDADDLHGPAPDEPPPPFRVLGWEADRSAIWYQPRSTGQIARVKPTGKAQLLLMGPRNYWASRYGSDKGVSWDQALSDLAQIADRVGVFDPGGGMRGRGIWRDGDQTVWHLGDVLEVDGTTVALADHASRHRYARLPALTIATDVPALTDAEGRAILDAVGAMGWEGPDHAALLLGWIVCAIAGGALPKRPGLQITSRTGSGKSTVVERVVGPLTAGAALLASGSTEAGLRQRAGCDALPVVNDETEAGEDGGRRERVLRLLRHSYDGTAMDKGTVTGKAINFPVRFAMALLAVNGTIPLATDANRIAVISRRHLPVADWLEAEATLQRLLTPEAGARLHRRIVDNLPTLLANVETFRRAVTAAAPPDIAGRTGDTYGPLLAGAALLLSGAPLDRQGASAVIGELGWAGPVEEAAERQGGEAEGRGLIRRILAHELPWRDPEVEGADTGRRTVGELLEMARASITAKESGGAWDALRRLGLKPTGTGVLVANDAEPLEPILKSTRWADGGHVARLRDLPGVEALQKPDRIIKGRRPVRGSYVPWEVLTGDE